MGKLDLLYEKFNALDLEFEKVTTPEECMVLYERYESLRSEIHKLVEEETRRQKRIEEIRSIPDNQSKKFRIKRVINKPIADFLINATVNNFTSIPGLKIRNALGQGLPGKAINGILAANTKCRVIIDNYPILPKDEPFLFISTHNFPEEIIATLQSLDRNAYVLLGTTDQIRHNSQMYAGFVKGTVYVDRLDPFSRNQAQKKEIYLIENGMSYLKYIEGSINNSPNLLVQELFPGTMKTINKTRVRVVPVSTFKDWGFNEIHLSFGEPLDLYTDEMFRSEKTDKLALEKLRDTLATMTYIQIKNFATRLNRKDLGEDPLLTYMEMRRAIYLETNWSKNTFAEEISPYIDKSIVRLKNVYEGFENIVVTPENAKIIASLQQELRAQEEYDRAHDMVKYMTENFDKPVNPRLTFKR